MDANVLAGALVAWHQRTEPLCASGDHDAEAHWIAERLTPEGSQFARIYHIGGADALVAAAHLRDAAKGLRWNADFPDNPSANEQRDTAEVLLRVAEELDPTLL